MPLQKGSCQTITNDFPETINKSYRKPSIIETDDGKDSIHKIFTVPESQEVVDILQKEQL